MLPCWLLQVCSSHALTLAKPASPCQRSSALLPEQGNMAKTGAVERSSNPPSLPHHRKQACHVTAARRYMYEPDQKG